MYNRHSIRYGIIGIRLSFCVTAANCGEFINKIIVTSLINYAVTYAVKDPAIQALGVPTLQAE